MKTTSPMQGKKYDRFSEKEDLSVLLVSGQTSLRLTMARYLQTLGSRMHAARSGQEAADIDASYMVDAIVVDAPLPDMPVPALLKRISEHRRLMRDIVDSEIVPCIIVSNDSKFENESGLSRLGVVATLRKPLNPKALGLLVKKILSGEIKVGEDKAINICVFDPEVRALEFFSRLLQADDVVIHELKDVFDIKEAIKDEKFDMFIAEIVGFDGDPVVTLKQIMSRAPKCTTIVCTALHDDNMHKQLMEAGVAEVITKPINPFNMRSLVRQYVSKLQGQ